MQETKERIEITDNPQGAGGKHEQPTLGSAAEAVKSKVQNAGGASQMGAELKTRPQEKGTTVADKAKDLAGAVADRSMDLAVAVGHAAGELASAVGQKTKDGASAVVHKIGDAASHMGHKAEEATTAVGGGMQSLAGTMREKGPHGGMLGGAADAVSQTLDNTGRYLKEEGLQGIGNAVANLIRRHPIQAVLLGIGVGYLLARSTRRS